MFGVCLRFSESRADAEDLLQEGFVRVFRDICQYRAEGSLEGWVRQVFIRTALDDLKSRKKLPATTDFAQLEYSFSENPDAFPDDLNDPEGAISMLQKLPPGFRAVLNLYVLEEKSHEEIARALGITASTSRSQLARAKEFLRKVILDNLLKMPVFL